MSQIHIIYYIFVSHPLNWIGSVKGQIEDLILSNLLSISHVHFCLSGERLIMNNAKDLINQLLNGVETISTDYSFTEQNQYEYPGFHKMYTLAKEYNSPNHYFVYIHTKGVSRSKSSSDRTIDNIYLNRLTLWNHEKVVELFNQLPQINKIGLFPSSGGWMWFNFFWVRGSYLKDCREPIVSPRRHYYEDWLGTSGKTGIKDCYCLYNDKIAFYFDPFKACRTIAQLYSSVKFLVITDRITKVYYGSGQKQIDISEKFQRILEQRHYIGINNALTEKDPCYGVVKYLTIVLHNGKTYEFREGEYILLTKSLSS